MNKDIPELSRETEDIRIGGIYKHFKGGTYQVICVARDSEDTTRELVVYQSMDYGTIWVRPVKIFIENVERDGYKGARFKLVK